MSKEIDEKTALTNYCTPEEKERQLGKAYVIATERDFPEKLKGILERNDISREDISLTPSVSEEKIGQAALLIGNSYILSTILSLPDNINTIYLCDLNRAVLTYAFKLIQCAKEADDYESFKKALYVLNDQSNREEKGQTNLIRPKAYTEEQWLKEKFLDEVSFNRYKSKINKVSLTIHYNHINLFDNKQTKELTTKIKKDNNKIAVINYSNVHQLACADEKSFNLLTSSLQEVAVTQPLNFYSIYVPDYNKLNAPELLYYKGCLQEHAKRLQGLHYFGRNKMEQDKLRTAIRNLGENKSEDKNNNLNFIAKVGQQLKNNKKKIMAGILVGCAVIGIAFTLGFGLISLAMAVGAMILTIGGLYALQKCREKKHSARQLKRLKDNSKKTATPQTPDSPSTTTNLTVLFGIPHSQQHASSSSTTPSIQLQIPLKPALGLELGTARIDANKPSEIRTMTPSL